jgi:hypothetical protein
LFIEDLKICQVKGRNDLSAGAVTEKDAQLFNGGADRIPFKTPEDGLAPVVNMLIGEVIDQGLIEVVVKGVKGDFRFSVFLEVN